MEQHENFMQKAYEEAQKGISNDLGGPFGAVIINQHGEIIGKGCNLVTSTNDPTAHAEVVAIRNACQNVKNFHLHNAILYTTCEPCPMCLAAIYWANIKSVFFVSSRYDAENADFSDRFIYDELAKDFQNRQIPLIQLPFLHPNQLFEQWRHKHNKIHY